MERRGESLTTREAISQRLRVSDQVKEALIQDILDGTLKPGDRLIAEDQIAQEFKVSKVTVREALRSLESEGLIEKRRGLFGGSYVSQPSSGAMEQAFSNCYRFGAVSPTEMVAFRKIVEPGFAALAAVSCTEEDLEKMEEHLSAVGESLSSGVNPRQRILEFHSLIAHACHNRLISAVSDALLDVFKEILSTVEMGLDLDREHLEYDKEIYACIRDRDPEGARKSMMVHFKTLAEIVRRSEENKAKRR
jgi:DNA-binding FadR family transcriptional regulator